MAGKALTCAALFAINGEFLASRLPMLMVGASILVGVHSFFDFSLQMPAISLTYATVLGLGVAQAFRTREQAQ